MMASETATKTLIGNHGNHLYGAHDQSGSLTHTGNHLHGAHDQSGSLTHTTAAGTGSDLTTVAHNSTSAANNTNVKVPKDEVGWYFVEQYYTTLSKTPEKIHLFYSRHSQFVSGLEAEKISVSVGQRAISDRIKELDIQDCKVRVTNVDSQESFKNIVVQVIGEMSNKAAPHRKFVQTFVLAEQPNGYFVLNDIFRYIVDDEEDEPENEESSALATIPAGEIATITAGEIATITAGEIATITAGEIAAITAGKPLAIMDVPSGSENLIADEHVDKKLEEEPHQIITSDNETGDSATQDTSLEAAESTDAVDETDASDAPVDATVTELEPHSDAKAGEVAQEASEPVPAAINQVHPEKSRDPDPTPIASPPAPPKPVATPAPPAIPARQAPPATWAALLAQGRVAQPAVPIQAVITPTPKPAQSSANRSATPPKEPTASPAPPQENGNSGWQTAGPENGRRQGRQQPNSGSGERGNVVHGYIKNVTERVDASELKETFLKHGKLAYFDVRRQRNCAFIEFTDPGGYNSAFAANPHTVGGEQIFLEERKPSAGAFGGNFNGRGGMRGGRGGAGGGGGGVGNDARPGGQGRGNYGKDGGRGGYPPRTRGNITPKGRGQQQAA